MVVSRRVLPIVWLVLLALSPCVFARSEKPSEQQPAPLKFHHYLDATNGRVHVMPSPMQLAECMTRHQRMYLCSGGEPADAVSLWTSHGIVPNAFWPAHRPALLSRLLRPGPDNFPLCKFDEKEGKNRFVLGVKLPGLIAVVKKFPNDYATHLAGGALLNLQYFHAVSLEGFFEGTSVRDSYACLAETWMPNRVFDWLQVLYPTIPDGYPTKRFTMRSLSHTLGDIEFADQFAYFDAPADISEMEIFRFDGGVKHFELPSANLYTLDVEEVNSTHVVVAWMKPYVPAAYRGGTDTAAVEFLAVFRHEEPDVTARISKRVPTADGARDQKFMMKFKTANSDEFEGPHDVVGGKAAIPWTPLGPDPARPNELKTAYEVRFMLDRDDWITLRTFDFGHPPSAIGGGKEEEEREQLLEQPL